MMHELLQKVYFVCRNVECSAAFCGTTEITHRMSPPLVPKPGLRIPYTEIALRRMKEAGYDIQHGLLVGDFSEPLTAREIRQKRRDRIKVMLAAGYSTARIQGDLLCSLASIRSVREQIKNQPGGETSNE